MERIGDSWNRIYIPQWRKPRVAQEQSFRGEGGGFLSPTPNTRTRPNNFSILLSSRYPVISHHLYVFSRSTGYPCPFVTARGKTHDTPFPISLHIFSFENVLSLSTFLCTFTSKVQVFIFLSNLEIGKKYLRATVSIIF